MLNNPYIVNGIIDLNSRSALPERINYHIDMATQEEPREKRDYIGASIIGGSCERQVQYHAMHAERNPGKGFPPRVLRCFERGHWLEAYAVKLIRKAGFVLLDIDPTTGKQWEFKTLGDRVAGHCDGIITWWRGQGESPIPLPALWECKCLNHKSTAKALKDKIRVSHPKYFYQVQLYMGEFKLSQCLFSICDADTMEFHHELVQFEPAVHASMLARGQRLINAIDHGEMLVRGFMDRTSFDCKYCDWARFCWEN